MKYIVTVTRTVNSTTEIEVSAKDEAVAQEKAEARIQKAVDAGEVHRFDWDYEDADGSFEYEVNEA